MSFSTAVITISDKVFEGRSADSGGSIVCAIAGENGLNIKYRSVVPNEFDIIAAELRKCTDELGITVVLTVGGTAFSPRDIVPEATLSVVEREARGIPEAMRAASMRITARGCLSRGAAGIRCGSLIVNLPGSEKAARENLMAVIEPILHGAEMLSASAAANVNKPAERHKKHMPSMEEWLKEAKSAPEAADCGMFLFHNGTVRRTAKAMVRQGAADTAPVTGMEFSYDAAGVEAAIKKAYELPGIYYVRVWLNDGHLEVGDDIMLVLIGGDIRPHVVNALQSLVGEIKTHCVTEKETY